METPLDVSYGSIRLLRTEDVYNSAIADDSTAKVVPTGRPFILRESPHPHTRMSAPPHTF